ncbi:hypothetical protein [Sediminicurvatus halobius]|uniref:hypothetical protein n=1 Tax=Sediminicurvatus halobius TaxID=2182432 RepID=UPI0011B1F119|nr:hypothetical protein [Spiribacter halobius]UEX78758.1 hypothetical protein LMH63_03685 [Spiribacter halobius]
MKSTRKRDIYADALERYREEVPMERWPVYAGAISRSGLAREIQARGFPSFERKRLQSAKCKPLVEAMDAAVKDATAAATTVAAAGVRATSGASDNAEIRRLTRKVERLETDLKNAERRAARYRDRCAVLESEKEEMRRQRDVFEEHCQSSLRTLHV